MYTFFIPLYFLLIHLVRKFCVLLVIKQKNGSRRWLTTFFGGSQLKKRSWWKARIKKEKSYVEEEKWRKEEIKEHCAPHNQLSCVPPASHGDGDDRASLFFPIIINDCINVFFPKLRHSAAAYEVKSSGEKQLRKRSALKGVWTLNETENYSRHVPRTKSGQTVLMIRRLGENFLRR